VLVAIEDLKFLSVDEGGWTVMCDRTSANQIENLSTIPKKPGFYRYFGLSTSIFVKTRFLSSRTPTQETGFLPIFWAINQSFCKKPGFCLTPE
jgi:hypothetical protein